MYTDSDRERKFYAVTYDDDVTTVARGSAIPKRYHTASRQSSQSVFSRLAFAVAPEAIVAVVLLALTAAFLVPLQSVTLLVGRK